MPAATIGTYIHAIEIGSDVALRSWFLATSPTLYHVISRPKSVSASCRNS